MDSSQLIDAVVRQTTLLIAQLATSAGLRAPLANLADQVFLDLAQEIERQGVSRNVTADMFGLALRSYQRKVHRLREGASVRERTLWQAVLEHVREHTRRTRAQLLAAFPRDEPEDVVAVLNDLVAGGLLYASGRGGSAVYGATSDGDQDAMVRERSLETLSHLIWLAVAEPPGLSRSELERNFARHVSLLDDALALLLEDKRITVRSHADQELYFAPRVLIPAGSEAGFETAVFDHFRAVCAALVNKLRLGGASSDAGLIGGTTLSFDVYAGHPHEQEIKGLLARVRADGVALWQRVADYNAEHPPPPERVEKVVFYAGQNYISNDSAKRGL